MTPDTDAAVIAAKLTEAQRRAVLKLIVPDGGGKWPARHALVDKGLMTGFPNYSFTPLARQVRAHLLGEQP